MGISRFLQLLLLGHTEQYVHVPPELKMQRLRFWRVWRNKNNNDFGVERLLRLLLVALPFVTPGLWWRHFWGRYGKQRRDLATDMYVLLKVGICAGFLWYSYNPAWLSVPIVLSVETVVYILSLIFLPDQHNQTIVVRRSILLILLNYVELNLTFASIYKTLSVAIPGTFLCAEGENLALPVTAFYFSMVTSATVGYGDITPQTPLAQGITVVHVIFSFVFAVLFFSYFTGRFPTLAKPKCPEGRIKN